MANEPDDPSNPPPSGPPVGTAADPRALPGELDMSDAAPPIRPPQPPPRVRWRRAWLLAPLLVLVGLAAIASLPFSATGTRWLLAGLQGLVGLQVETPSGALLGGDFSARRVRYAINPQQTLVIDQLAWQALRREPVEGSWGRVHLQRLSAARIDVQGSSTSDQPLRLPTDLQLPVAVEVDRIEVGELVLDVIRERPVRQISARLSLGEGSTGHHRLDDLRLQWDRLALQAQADLAAAAPLTLQASARLTPKTAPDAPAGPVDDWRVELQARGPLADLALDADLRARGQALQAQARLQIEAALPVTRLLATLDALDLAPLASGLPLTALSGRIELQLDPQRGGRAAQPLAANASLRNAAAGALADGRIPLREVEIKARSDLNATDHGQVESLRLLLGTERAPAGALTASGRWALIGQGAARHVELDIEAQVDGLQPQRLHPASPALQIGGPLAWHLSQPWPAAEAPVTVTPGTTPGTAPGATKPGFQTELRTRLTGRLIGSGLPAVTLALEGEADPERLQIAKLQADAGGAQLAGQGSLTRRNGALNLQWRNTLKAFDTSIWLPRPAQGAQASAIDRLLGAGPHQLNGQLEADLQWPAQAPRTLAGLAQLRGRARFDLQPSRWAGLPVAGQWQVNSNPSAASAQPHVNTRLALQIGAAAAITTLKLSGELDPVGSHDQWQLDWNSADLGVLGPWLNSLAGSAGAQLAGRTEGQAMFDGRWPRLTSRGQLSAADLRWSNPPEPPVDLHDLQGRWRLGTTAADPVEIDLRLDRAQAAGWLLNGLVLSAEGSGADHHLRVDVASATQLRKPAGSTAPATAAAQASAANAAPLMLSAHLKASGALEHETGLDLLGWRGRIEQLELRENDPRPGSATAAAAGAAPVSASGVSAPPATSAAASAAASAPAQAARYSRPLRLVVDPTNLHIKHAPTLTTVTLEPTRAHLGDLHLALQEFAWQQERRDDRSATRLALRSQLDSIDMAPLLQSLQPGFGWGGDLRIGGRIDIQATPERFALEASLQRDSGDLQVTDPDNPKNPQRLGLADLRVALSAREGRWRLTQMISGGNLGRLVGEQRVDAPPAAMWPAASAPVTGQISLQVAQLGNWGRWLPAGWRLSGQLDTQARLSGSLGNPELSGELTGRNMAVRNLLQGVDWRDAQLHVRLDGSTARVDTASVRAGDGSLSAQGAIQLGATPRLDLDITADHFAVLQRVDRRIVASGQAKLQLDARSTVLKGQLRADEGRIDFSQSDAPGLADDVDVQRPEEIAARERAAAAARSQRTTVLDLRADLGPAFTLKGRGLATRLAGELRLTSPGNRLAIAGVIRAEEGLYAAYGQKLTVDRGLITFISAPDNPRLDIEASRTDLEDVRVGVTITGTAQAPRIRLFSVPSMSDTDKLSWLVLGRASDGLGRTDLSLLQRAAFALLTGESDSPSLIERIGLDQLSVRQSDTGDTRETVLSLGKQLSRRWYVGYERSLNAAAGTWQLIYRAAQRFTLRAQSGSENALDVIWTWKWGDKGERIERPE